MNQVQPPHSVPDEAVGNQIFLCIRPRYCTQECVSIMSSLYVTQTCTHTVAATILMCTT